MGVMAKRFFLYFTVNLFIMATLAAIYFAVLVFVPEETAKSAFMPLFLFAAIFGFGGAFISLFLSKFIAKKFMGVQIIASDERDERLRWVLETTHRLSKKAGLMKMPEVGVYHSPEINAFATGPSRKNSLVAVSTGLLNSMNRDGAEGVIGHEVAHIANGDMVTMTLVQGVVNTVVIIVAHIIVNFIKAMLRQNRTGHGGMSIFMHYLIYNIVHSILAFAAMPIVAFVSRIREYRADAGGAKLAGREKMVMGLRELKRFIEGIDNRHPSLSTLKISSKPSILRFWSTHPPLDERIKRLQTGAYTRY